MAYLLAISIGPVQDFISAARKTRDLAAGSQLLSELAGAAAKEIANMNGELIFPVLDGNSGNDSLPNKMLAIVDSPDRAGEAAEKAVRQKLKKIWEEIIYENGNPKKWVENSLDIRDAERQIEDILEIYLAAVPYDESQHGKSRKTVDYLLSARKSLRNFGPVTWGSSKPKSSLDGQREAVINLTDKYINLARKLGLKHGEQLCAPGLLKRLYKLRHGGSESFPGTSHFAALPFLSKLSDIKEYIKELKTYFPEERSFEIRHGDKSFLDGRFLFESEINDIAAEYYSGDENADKQQEAVKNITRKLKEILEAAKPDVPSPYYAILLADGDDMGKVLASIKSKREHQDFSRKLAEFANQAKGIVERACGRLVYAGGDDVLAFLPLNTTLKCASEISKVFSESLKAILPNENLPTMSIGIVVKHYIEPLSDALELARSAEAIAKAFPGKGAIAITLDKRGGAPRTICGKARPFINRMQKLMEYERSGNLSHQAAYELRDLCGRLNLVRESVPLPEMSAALGLETHRILARKISTDKEGPESNRKKELIEAIMPAGNGTTISAKTILDLADELVIAAMFAKCGAEIQEGGKNSK
jgi:CRISPR-associated protein Cmr2